MSKPLQQELRDMVIELKVKLDELTKKVDNLNDNFAHRLENVEIKKLSFEDFRMHKSEIANEICDLKESAKDRETRIRRLEWSFLIATGAFFAVEFYLKYLR